MKLNVGSTLKRAKQIEGEIIKLRDLRKDVATVTYSDIAGTDIIKPERTVDCVTAEIKLKQEASRFLRRAVTKANIEIFVNYELNGERITLAEALTLLPQKINEVADFTELANKRPLERIAAGGRWSGSSAVEYIKVQYEIPDAKKYLKNAENELNALRSAIDEANVTNWIEVPDKYLA